MVAPPEPPSDAPHPPGLDDLLRDADAAAGTGDWTAASRAWLEALGRYGAEVGDVSDRLTEAAGHLRRRADAGDAAAGGVLALLLAEHADDPGVAIAAARGPAEAGDPLAQRVLGFLLREGHGDARGAEATTWLQRAADQGDGPAMMVVAGDDPQGDLLLARAAALGFERAGSMLGDRLSARDQDPEALAWYVWTAERGHVGAIRAAADWYRDGFGTDPDPAAAVRWYITLLEHGDGDGVHEAIRLVRETGLPPEQVRAAAALAGRPSAAEALLDVVHGGSP